VQHLDCLSDDEKDVFKTAFELDQRWLIELAGDRTPFVCQSQSLNLFLAADVHKRDLQQIHALAWKKGVKSLYYCRSKSMQRAESSKGDVAPVIEAASPRVIPHLGKVNSGDAGNRRPNGHIDYDECLACQ
jgi:ribonucleoside-diphosphate reductase alpha chain